MQHQVISLYSSMVMHRRLYPVSYRFMYRLFNILVDIDQLDVATKHSPVFSANRFNLFSFYVKDHLLSTATSLRETADTILAKFNVSKSPSKIYILCFPRVLGCVFNPLSIWYCLDNENQPVAIICEVRNTFGEKHFYLLSQEQTLWPVKQRHAKQFHVSPFIGMDADYEFRISRPGALSTVGIREYENNELMLVASMKCQRIEFNSWNLILQSIRVPFQTVKVLAAIHWQALWIWIAGAPLYYKPAPPEKEVS